MKRLKPLPQNPLVQRMEDITFPLVKGNYTGGVNKNRHGNVLKPSDFDMTFPMMKPAKKTKAMHQWDMTLKESAQSLENQRCKNCGVYPGSHHADRCESLLEIRKRAWKEYKKNDKVTWEGREWLRSISDPHHGRHVFMVLVLIAAVIIAGIILW